MNLSKEQRKDAIKVAILKLLNTPEYKEIGLSSPAIEREVDVPREVIFQVGIRKSITFEPLLKHLLIGRLIDGHQLIPPGQTKKQTLYSITPAGEKFLESIVTHQNTITDAKWTKRIDETSIETILVQDVFPTIPELTSLSEERQWTIAEGIATGLKQGISK